MNTELSNTLVPLDLALDDDERRDLHKSANLFLPRVQLFGSNSAVVQEKKINGGHYGIVDRDSLIDLGESFDALILNERAKAINTKGPEGKPVSYLDPKTSEFKEVVQMSREKNNGCFWGPEYLIYLPEQGLFATFLCGSWTARLEAPNISLLLGRMATFTSILKRKTVDGEKRVWSAPKILPCTVPPKQIPDLAELAAENAKFKSRQPIVEDVSNEETEDSDERPQ